MDVQMYDSLINEREQLFIVDKNHNVDENLYFSIKFLLLFLAPVFFIFISIITAMKPMMLSGPYSLFLFYFMLSSLNEYLKTKRFVFNTDVLANSVIFATLSYFFAFLICFFVTDSVDKTIEIFDPFTSFCYISVSFLLLLKITIDVVNEYKKYIERKHSIYNSKKIIDNDIQKIEIEIENENDLKQIEYLISVADENNLLKLKAILDEKFLFLLKDRGFENKSEYYLHQKTKKAIKIKSY